MPGGNRYIVGEDAAIRVLCGLGRIEAQHVRQQAFDVDRGDGFFRV